VTKFLVDIELASHESTFKFINNISIDLETKGYMTLTENIDQL